MSKLLVLSPKQALILKEILNEASHVEELVALKLGMEYDEVNDTATALWRKLRGDK